MADFDRVLPILVEFGIGAVMCGAGVWYGIRSGYIDLTRRADRNLMWLIAAGYLGLLIVCAAFTFWLPFLPAKTAP